MSDFVTFRELADQIGVEITTIRRNVKRLDLEIRNEKTETSKGARVQCLSIDNANLLISHFENRDKPISNSDSAALDRFGYFYIIQLIPEAVPDRVKIGYTDNLETRLREHQTAAPTAKYLGHWKCKRSWDQAAMDSITRTDCSLVMNEVYEGDINGFLKRADEFFKVMPKDSNKPGLSEHSPLRGFK
ncbi:GIY-YIG nuclease family protein [bacterium]|nr:GIY-YIG nuclease family protein [bacterium]